MHCREGQAGDRRRLAQPRRAEGEMDLSKGGKYKKKLDFEEQKQVLLSSSYVI